MNSSLFRAVDVGELEATVLAKAEQRGRDGTIPKFVCSKGLGFGRSSLGSFCSTTDPLILHMAADVARREGRELRDGGVANLAARDRVCWCVRSPDVCMLLSAVAVLAWPDRVANARDAEKTPQNL